MYEVQHWTLCDGWINVWTQMDDDGNETPAVYVDEQDAQDALDQYLLDTLEAYQAGDLAAPYDKSEFRIRPVMPPSTRAGDEAAIVAEQFDIPYERALVMCNMD